MRLRRWMIGFGCILVGLGPLRAQQNPDPVVGQSTQSFPSVESVNVSNSYLRLDMRVPEVNRTLRPGTGTPPGPPTDIGFSNFRGGRVTIRTINGDPFTLADNNLFLASGNWQTYSSIRVGSTGLTTTTARVYEAETLFQYINDPTQNIIIDQPVASSNSLSFAWRIQQDHPTQTAILRSPLTVANGGLSGSTSAAILQVRQTYRLVRDMVRIEVAVTNISDTDQVVGVKTLVDPQFGGGVNDGQALYVSGVREGLTREFLFPSARVTDEAGLRQIPKTWRTFDNQTSPGVILGGVWDNGDIRGDSLSAGVPQSVAFVNADFAGASSFGYTPLNLDLINENWAVQATWTEHQISPSQTKRFITYFGLAGADSNLDGTYALSAEAPFSLKLQTGDNPQTAAAEGAENAFRSPNPFTLRAFINNTGTRPLSNMAVSIALPDGFVLAGANDTISKSVPTVPAGTEQEVSWTIRSEDTQRPGVRVITVSSAGPAVSSKVIEREIGIPALPRLDFPSVTRRLDMISVPYDFTNRDLEHIFQSLGSLGVTGGGNAAVARYDPSARAYSFFPDPFITSVLPGEAIWLFNGSLAQVQLPADRQEIDPTTQVAVSLTPDWNQVGCPYTVPTRLFDAQVVTSDNTVRTFTEAVNAGIVRPVLYEYEPNPVDPSLPGQYLFSGDSSTLFNPWRGYWLRVLQQVSMVYSATSLVGPFRANGPDYLRLSGGWEIGLDALAGGLRSQTVTVGQDPSSQDGHDLRDVDAPPPVRAAGNVRLAVVHPDWGRNSGGYLRDIRGASGAPARWLLQCDSDLAHEPITLRWNLRQAPADVQFTLTDLQTGARRHMRTTSGYAFDSGAFGGARMLQVTAERRTRPLLAVPLMTATPGRGRSVGIAFTLTAAATVEVVIESPTGRRVRTLAVGFEGQAGQNVLGWDGRDDAQRPVPTGQYRCRVLVHTSDGQRAVAERIVMVGR